MSSNDPRPEVPANTTETVDLPTTSNTATSTSIDASKLAAQVLSAEELSQLERDMQLSDPAEVVLPGGHTLKDVLDVQRENEAAAARQRLKDFEEGKVKLPETSSTVMTTESVIAVSETGQIVTVPLGPKPTDEQTSREAE